VYRSWYRLGSGPRKMTPSRKEARELSDVEKWQIEEIKKGIAAADRGEFASDEEVEQVLKRWTRGHPMGNG
jgi:predicted transcriptional regulator